MSANRILPAKGTVHVVIAGVPRRMAPEELALLSRPEQARLETILHVRAARDFVAGRALMRRVLGAMTGIDPCRLRIGVRDGRPFLVDNTWALDMSLSHGGGWLCLAIGRAVAVGADIEPLPDPAHVEGVARLMLSDRECCFLRRLQGEARAAIFCRLWTRREAALKRMGIGLSGNDPNQCHLGRPELLRYVEGRCEGVRWCVVLPASAKVEVRAADLYHWNAQAREIA